MSGRNLGPSHQINGVGFSQLHESSLNRPRGPISHPALFEEMMISQFNREGRSFPPRHSQVEKRLAMQHDDIQELLLDNQRLAATHVALKQDIEVAQYELKRMSEIAGSLQPEKDVEFRQVFEKSMKMEAELRVVEEMRGEFVQVCDDIKKINASRKELAGQVEVLTQDLLRANAEAQQAPVLKADIETMKQELQRARSAIEYEKKGQAENYEKGQAMERDLVLMAREVEMLRAEIANAQRRARAVAAVGSSVPGYGGNYSNPNIGYGGNQYSGGHGTNPIQDGAESTAQYGARPATWGAYDTQHGAYDMQHGSR